MARTDRRRVGATAAALGLAAALIACASRSESALESGWKTDWNARDGAADTRWENPCGDPEFDPWARGFIGDCDPVERLGRDECEQRRRWLEQRIEQCNAWKAYLLRNHGQQRRDDDAPEPPTHVE
jgi:hypothetical protein